MSGQVTDDIKSSLRFLDYNVEEFEFSLNDEFKDESVKIQFDINRDIQYSKDTSGDNFTKSKVILDVNIFKDPIKNNYPFSLHIRLAGFFKIEDLVPEAKKMVEVNAVAILFPYVRSLVTTITANANVNSLILPPINVIKLIEDQENK